MSLIHLEKPKEKSPSVQTHSDLHRGLRQNTRFITISEKKCPLCNKQTYVYTTCFDCKKPIQWICYKCAWESNLRVHDACYKNVSIYDDGQDKNTVKFGTKEKLEDYYRFTLQKVALMLSLYY